MRGGTLVAYNCADAIARVLERILNEEKKKEEK
jgi:tRNA G37 N-methylase TrmD